MIVLRYFLLYYFPIYCYCIMSWDLDKLGEYIMRLGFYSLFKSFLDLVLIMCHKTEYMRTIQIYSFSLSNILNVINKEKTKHSFISGHK